MADHDDAVAKRMKEAIKAEILRKQFGATPSPAAEPEKFTPEKEAEAPPPPPKEVVVGANQKLFSELCSIKTMPKGIDDFAVTLLDKGSIPEQLKGFVPNVLKNYIIQPDAAAALLQAWEYNERSLITGPTGSGKSSLVAQLCALTNRPNLRVNMTADIESSTLFGSLVVEDGATVWKDGPITEAVVHGAVVSIDEWDVTPPEILFGMQWLFESDGMLYLKEKPGASTEKFLLPHPEFRVVCLGNTLGQGDEFGKHAGVNVQNSATLDRFQTTIFLNYLSQSHEKKVVRTACPGLAADFVGRMIQLAALVRTAYDQGNINLTMSPRTLINWGAKTERTGNAGRSLQLAFANKLRDNDNRILDEMHTKVFGTSFKA